MQESGRRAIIAAFCANFVIALAKFVGFAFTGAASMLAEAVHSVADTGNQALLILSAIEAQEGVLQVIHLRTQHIGPEEILVGSKVAIATHYTLPDVARCIDAIEAAIRKSVPDARVIYIEPDLLRETATSE